MNVEGDEQEISGAESKDLRVLLNNIRKVASRVGIKRLNSILAMHLLNSRISPELIDDILCAICSEFSISKKELLKLRTPASQETKIRIRAGKTVLCGILHFELKMPVRTISKALFDTPHTLPISRALSKHKAGGNEYREKYNRVWLIIKTSKNLKNNNTEEDGE